MDSFKIILYLFVASNAEIHVFYNGYLKNTFSSLKIFSSLYM